MKRFILIKFASHLQWVNSFNYIYYQRSFKKKKIDNLNSCVSIFFLKGSQLKIFPQKTFLAQTVSVINFKGEILPFLHKHFQKNEKEETFPILLYESGTIQIPRVEKGYYKERKLQTNISHKYRYKILKEILPNQIQFYIK